MERDQANLGTSYINSWWFDLYVQDRRPLPLNFTPQLTFRDDPVAAKNEQARKAADMIVSAVRFKRTLDADLLRPDVFFINNETKEGWMKDAGMFTTLMKLIPSGMTIPFKSDTSVHSAYGHLKGAYPLDMSQFKVHIEI